MVATRDPDTDTHAPTHEEPLAFTRYDHPYDLTAVGAEDAPGGVSYVPLVTHPSFTAHRRVTKAQRREALIKQAAIRIMAGLEERSLRELADEIGCTHTAIHNALQRFCVRLGLRPVRFPAYSIAAKLREERRRRLALRS